MIHPRHFQFTNAEIVDMDPFHKQLRELSDFLWNDPRPHAEGNFEMRRVATGWSWLTEDAQNALSRCGTAACACGWEMFRSGDERLFSRTILELGPETQNWMFSGGWTHVDNTPFGASFRIDHYLKHRDRSAYSGDVSCDMAAHYPPNPFWLEAAQ